MHDFIAYVDEAGEEGFDHGSSNWFVMSACITRAIEAAETFQDVDPTVRQIEKLRSNGNSNIHFQSLPHQARLAVAYAISRSRFVAITICINKVETAKTARFQSGLDKNKRFMYFYEVKLLLERISKLCDERSNGNICQLELSRCKKINYAELTAYLKSESRSFNINHKHFDLDAIQVTNHNDSYGCRIADAIASSYYAGLEVSRFGLCEDQYSTLLRNNTYNVSGNYLDHGLRFVPRPPIPELDKNNRYKWIDNYK